MQALAPDLALDLIRDVDVRDFACAVSMLDFVLRCQVCLMGGTRGLLVVRSLAFCPRSSFPGETKWVELRKMMH